MAYRRTWLTWVCFGIIYFVWGSTFLAIRVGVREVPPFLLASMRFTVAGLVLFFWMVAKGEKLPARREWRSIALVALLIFVFDYGLLFWAEQRAPSGIAAVMMATIPVFMALAEIVFLRTERMTARLGLALLAGTAGVAVLTLNSFGGHSLPLGAPAIAATGAVALVFASLSWAVASILTRKLPLPASKGISSGAQMLAGGVMLAVASAGLGEWRGFRIGAVSGEAWFALVYLIVLGSVVGFTAYLWLLHHESPTTVGTYAYVNPVVAVLLGHLAGGEPLGARTAAGTLLVLVSVVTITTRRKVATAPISAGNRPYGQDLSPGTPDKIPS